MKEKNELSRKIPSAAPPWLMRFIILFMSRCKKNVKPTQIPANRHFIKISQTLSKKVIANI
jgi:hypothetical protein